MKWHVGARAEIISSGNMPRFLGEHVTVTALVTSLSGRNGCEVDIPATGLTSAGPNGGLCYSCQHLKPIPYDGNQASTWEDCVFKPKELVVLDKHKV